MTFLYFTHGKRENYRKEVFRNLTSVITTDARAIGFSTFGIEKIGLQELGYP